MINNNNNKLMFVIVININIKHFNIKKYIM